MSKNEIEIKVVAKSKPIPKKEWRRRLADAFGPKAGKGILEGLPAAEFKKAMGPPDDIDTIEGLSFWYYDCSDGMLQLELDGPLLNESELLRGKINEE